MDEERLSQHERDLLAQCVRNQAEREALQLTPGRDGARHRINELRHLHDKLQAYYQVILQTPTTTIRVG